MMHVVGRQDAHNVNRLIAQQIFEARPCIAIVFGRELVRSRGIGISYRDEIATVRSRDALAMKRRYQTRAEQSKAYFLVSHNRSLGYGISTALMAFCASMSSNTLDHSSSLRT